MRILALDGSQHAFSAAFLDTASPDSVRSAEAEAGKALESGIALAERVLGGQSLSGIDRIAVGVGPGSFTGIRIALSFAKGLALATDIPLVGISSYDILVPSEAPTPFLALVRGRVGVACARLRTPDGAHTCCGSYEKIASFVAERLRPATLPCGGDLEGVAPYLGEAGFIVRAYSPAKQPAALAIAHLCVDRDPAPSLHAVTPDYGEAPQFVARSTVG